MTQLTAQNATEQKTPKHEIKVNALTTLFGSPEISYERILSGASSAGISIQVATHADLDNHFMLTPYYRAYFGNKRAAGFFVEVNAAAFSHRVYEGKFFDDEDVAFGMGWV